MPFSKIFAPRHPPSPLPAFPHSQARYWRRSKNLEYCTLELKQLTSLYLVPRDEVELVWLPSKNVLKCSNQKIVLAGYVSNTYQI